VGSGELIYVDIHTYIHIYNNMRGGRDSLVGWAIKVDLMLSSRQYGDFDGNYPALSPLARD
jgi:hypothetical protein